ncbi:MAG TPA: squalene synthase HpnC [Methylotenera sp.]|nr:squalene synthase HpnC [Methylotenera sp.]HPH04415.1 squalene synthase HpnC [Methylotenera sp.]HPM99969.1 squalene synthase HpnC [Methylotenera sp.]
MTTTQATETVISASLALTRQHYENFPVASIFLPKHLRVPVSLIYQFARQADDFADEGPFSVDQRLAALNNYRDELALLQAYIKPKTTFFSALGATIKDNQLSFAPFFDLLDAFSQDVTKTRYINFEEVLDYCKRSANPVGRLMLELYGQSNQKNIYFSDHICTALQLINFLQDVAIDFNKNAGKQRIYMCQDELEKYNIDEQDIANLVAQSKNIDEKWQQFMQFNCQRASTLMQIGKPLGRVLKGRIGFELRMMIAGGERIIDKITAVRGDVFKLRPTLHVGDWLIIFFKALLKR